MIDKIKHRANSYLAIILLNISYWFWQRRRKNRFFQSLYKFHERFVRILAHIHLYDILDVKEYGYLSRNVTSIDIERNRVGYTGNVVYNTTQEKQELYAYPLPDLALHTFHNICICGDSDLLIDEMNKCVVNDFCRNKDNRTEYYDSIVIKMKGQMVMLRDVSHISRSLPSGIMISGKFSRNYYHDVYENLIRLVVLDEVDIPKDVPLIVDDFVMRTPSLKRILEILSSNLNREIITIGVKEIIAFEMLYTVSPVNHITPHIKDASTCQLSDFVFDLSVVNRMRERLLPYKSDRKFPRRLFLSRANTQHRKFNEDEVFAVLAPLGFERIAPEQYSIEDQMAMFNGAEYIVGGTGASFTNLLFCNKCKIICIRANQCSLAPIFTTLAYSNDCVMLYYGSSNSHNSIITHANFHIDIEEFSDTLQVLMSDNEQNTQRV
jgi:capsular polysaccharide biosynthesis protein